MPDGTTQTAKAFLQYLPAIYQEDPFIGQWLAAFEKVLLGRNDGFPYPPLEGVKYPAEGLEETVAGLATLFDPQQTPEEFLSWLSGWTALSLRADLEVAKQRDFIAKIIQLYRRRGTNKNLEELLMIFTAGIAGPTVTEFETALEIGKHSAIGKDTRLGDGPPHFFRVTISLQKGIKDLPRERARLGEIVSSLIELEKPAHTHYALEFVFPSMQIGKTSKIGVDTLLGTIT
jgi:phage tail-like protein